MLFPRHDIDGLDLDNRAIEGGASALCMILLILARAGRLRRLRHLNPATFVACLPGATAEMIAIAGLLEAGQSLVHVTRAPPISWLTLSSSLRWPPCAPRSPRFWHSPLAGIWPSVCSATNARGFRA
jgi:hypothetical protein